MNKLKFLCIMLLALSVPALAGKVFEATTQDHSQSPPAVGSCEIMVEQRHLKMTISSGEGPQKELIYNSDLDQVLVVDHNSKTTTVVESPLKSDSGFPTGKELERILAGMTPEQQEEFKKGMELAKQHQPSLADKRLRKVKRERKRKLPRTRVTNTQGAMVESTMPAQAGLAPSGKVEEKQGYEAVQYSRQLDAQRTQYLWATHVSELESETLERLASFSKDLRADPKRFDQFNSLFPNGKNPFTLIFVGGNQFTVEAGEVEYGVSRLLFEFEGGDIRDLDPEAFYPPAGYRRRTMGGFFQ